MARVAPPRQGPAPRQGAVLPPGASLLNLLESRLDDPMAKEWRFRVAGGEGDKIAMIVWWFGRLNGVKLSSQLDSFAYFRFRT